MWTVQPAVQICFEACNGSTASMRTSWINGELRYCRLSNQKNYGDHATPWVDPLPYTLSWDSVQLTFNNKFQLCRITSQHETAKIGAQGRTPSSSFQTPSCCFTQRSKSWPQPARNDWNSLALGARLALRVQSTQR